MAKKKSPRQLLMQPQFQWLCQLWSQLGLGEPFEPRSRVRSKFIKAIWDSALNAMPGLLEHFGVMPQAELPAHARAERISRRKRSARHVGLIRHYLSQLGRIKADHLGGTPYLARHFGGLDASLANIALGAQLSEAGLAVTAFIHCNRSALLIQLAPDDCWYADVQSDTCGRLIAADMASMDKARPVLFDLVNIRRRLGVRYEYGLSAPFATASAWRLLQTCAFTSLQQLKYSLPDPDAGATLSLHSAERDYHPKVTASGEGLVRMLQSLFPEIMAGAMSRDFQMDEINLATVAAMERLMQELRDPDTDQMFAASDLHDDAIERLTGAKALFVLPVIIDGRKPPPSLEAALADYLMRFGRAVLAGGPALWNRELHTALVQKLYNRQLREADNEDTS